MQYNEKSMDLFTSDYECALVHCISADFMMGAGIARTFSDLGIKSELKRTYLENIWDGKGYCLHTSAGTMTERFPNGVFNLVTKERYFHKPTIQTLGNALVSMKEQCLEHNIYALAMPTIGCGLDRLPWAGQDGVSKLIQDVFRDTDIRVTVAKFERLKPKNFVEYIK